jgi:hypothetical protein
MSIPDNPFEKIIQNESQTKSPPPSVTEEPQINPFTLNKGEERAFNKDNKEDSPPFDIGNETQPNIPTPNVEEQPPIPSEPPPNLAPNNSTMVNQQTTVETPNQQPTGNETVVQNQQPNLNLEGGVSMQNQNQSFSSPPPQGFGGSQPQQEGFGNPQQQPPQGFGGSQPQQEGFGNPQQQPPQQQAAAAPPQQQAPQQGGFNPQQGGFSPPQQGFGGGGGQQQGFGGGGGQQQGGGSKYNITDLYWFVNRKLFSGGTLDQGEAGLMTIGFNASFGNLRLSLHGINNNSFTQSSIIMENCQRLAICNIHSEIAAQILASKGNGQPVQLLERVIKAGNWTPNVSQITWQTSVTVQSQDQQGNAHIFTMLDDQVTAFESALGFMIDGNAWVASLMSVITRNA